MSKLHKTKAHGKLIFSGEHAVIYGNPAIAMAINKFVTTTLLNDSGSIISNLPKLSAHTLTTTINQFKLTLPHNLKIEVTSDIPISCGMGSSAATIVSLMYAITTFLKTDRSMEDYFQLGREIENLPHGRSSGVDIYLALHGGCVRFENDKITSRSIPDIPMYIVNTGKPKTTTKECVAAAAKYFKSNTLLQDFAAVTNEFDQALQANNLKNMQECIRANHQLLTKIGVVPEPIQQFIAELEQAGAAAKICGAGAITGKKAGAILVVTEKDIFPIVAKYNYEIFKVRGTEHGVQII